MKKLISGLVAAFLLSAGFVAVSAETASAACKPTQYTQCKPTSTSTAGSSKSVKKGKKPKVVVTVKAQGGGKPSGTATVSIKGPGIKFSKNLTVKNGKLVYTGPALKKKGTYKVTITFKAKGAYKDAKTVTYTIKVK